MSTRLEVKAADARPHVLPLLAHDVVEAGHGAGPGAARHGVGGEQGTTPREVTGAHERFERLQPLLGCRSGSRHGGIMRGGPGPSLAARVTRDVACCWS